MISITTQRFLIVYSDIILQKNVFFPHVQNFALVVVLFGYLAHGHFGQFFTQYFVWFFKYSLNFQGPTLKSELNKVWCANFIEFKYDSTNPLKEWAFEKTNKQCFYLHFAKSNFIVIVLHFIFNIKKKLFHNWNLHKIYVFNNIFIRSWL